LNYLARSWLWKFENYKFLKTFVFVKDLQIFTAAGRFAFKQKIVLNAALQGESVYSSSAEL